MTDPTSIGRSSEEEPPHKVTLSELLQLLKHPSCDLERPVSVKVPYGWASVDYASISAAGNIQLYLSEEWQ